MSRQHGEPDARLHSELRERLAASPYAALRRIDFKVRGAKVTLRGAVRSYFLKQMAQHVVGEMGEVEVVNELQVA